jgi:hypothetical protein
VIPKILAIILKQGGANENIITGTWNNEIHFDELEEHENLAGPNHNLPYGSSEKDSFYLYVVNRKGWPLQFRKPALLKLKRGESRKLQNEDVTAIVWQDKRTVQLLSTNSDPLNYGAVKRKTGKGNEEIEIPCPQAIINYTKYMGGVDISDQKREYYGVGRSSKNWWKFIFHSVINVCVVNSFILYDLNKCPPLTAHGPSGAT